MRLILDKLSYGRNIAKGHGEHAPVPPCPLCHTGEDSLEHITHCSDPTISASRREHFRSLDDKLFSYCDRNSLPDAALSLSRAYLVACASTELPDIDILGGWLGIPVPRFHSFFNPNIYITEPVAAGLRLLIPRIIADSLDWLHSTWETLLSGTWQVGHGLLHSHKWPIRVIVVRHGQFLPTGQSGHTEP